MSAVLDEAKKRLDDALASLEGAIIRSELRGPSSDKYEAELDALRSDRARLAEQIDSAKAEIRQLSELSESTKAEMSRVLERDAARIRALEADLASLEGEKGRMSAEVDSVRAEVQLLSEQNAKALSLAEKAAAFEAELASARAERAQLTEQLEAAKTEIRHLAALNERASATIGGAIEGLRKALSE